MTRPQSSEHALRLSLESAQLAEAALEAGRPHNTAPEIALVQASRAQAFVGLARFYRNVARDMEATE